jgi:hypothetical protein
MKVISHKNVGGGILVKLVATSYNDYYYVFERRPSQIYIENNSVKNESLQLHQIQTNN